MSKEITVARREEQNAQAVRAQIAQKSAHNAVVRENGMEARLTDLVKRDPTFDALFELTTQIALATDANFAIDLVSEKYEQALTHQTVVSLHYGNQGPHNISYGSAKLQDALLKRFATAYIASLRGEEASRTSPTAPDTAGAIARNTATQVGNVAL